MNVETDKSMRVLDGKNPQPNWERFNRLQETANFLPGGMPHPKGVFRFKSWAEFDEWKMNCRIRGGLRGKTTS